MECCSRQVAATDSRLHQNLITDNSWRACRAVFCFSHTPRSPLSTPDSRLPNPDPSPDSSELHGLRLIMKNRASASIITVHRTMNIDRSWHRICCSGKPCKCVKKEDVRSTICSVSHLQAVAARTL